MSVPKCECFICESKTEEGVKIVGNETEKILNEHEHRLYQQTYKQMKELKDWIRENNI